MSHSLSREYQIFFSLFIIWFLFPTQLHSQTLSPEQLGFSSHTISDEELGDIHYYVSQEANQKEKPILLYLDGSGPYPLFQYTDRGIGSSVLIDFRKLSADYEIVLISKPGIPFIDTISMNRTTGFPEYKPTDEYNKRLSLDWRVETAQQVLDTLLSDRKVANSQVIVLGISEGFQVGAKLISSYPKITHAVLLVGNGLSQFYDFIIQNRILAEQGRISKEIAQTNIDSLYQIIAKINANPYAVDKEWYGHTYLRWSSFCNNNPTANILSSEISVYIVACAEDRNTSVLGTDYLYLESILQQKSNITYRVYPYDHAFNAHTRDADGRILSTSNYKDEVLEKAFEWLATK